MEWIVGRFLPKRTVCCHAPAAVAHAHAWSVVLKLLNETVGGEKKPEKYASRTATREVKQHKKEEERKREREKEQVRER